MPFPVELQDNLAVQLMPAGSDPARAALEDMAVEAYRARRLSEQQLATVPGMDRYELAGFLKKREVWLDYTADDLRREVEVGERLWRERDVWGQGPGERAKWRLGGKMRRAGRLALEGRRSAQGSAQGSEPGSERGPAQGSAKGSGAAGRREEELAIAPQLA